MSFIYERINKFFFLIACLCSLLFGEEFCIVYVHIGDTIPEYAHDAISQAALFNPECPVYMLASQEALGKFDDPIAIGIPLEELEMSEHHKGFLNDYPIKDGLFLFSLERFFYLEEFMSQFNQNHVFHFEYDNMLYADLNELLPIFQQCYPQAAVPFDNDERAIPGIVYISSPKSMTCLAAFISDYASKRFYDMYMLGYYKNVTEKTGIDHLPIIHKSYTEENALISPRKHIAKKPEDYSRNIEKFNSIFDAAAIGQYLGGIDPSYNKNSEPGFINESCVFNPSKLIYIWEEDALGRKVPYAIYKKEKRRINNIHVHCKNLKKFAS